MGGRAARGFEGNAEPSSHRARWGARAAAVGLASPALALLVALPLCAVSPPGNSRRWQSAAPSSRRPRALVLGALGLSHPVLRGSEVGAAASIPKIARSGE